MVVVCWTYPANAAFQDYRLSMTWNETADRLTRSGQRRCVRTGTHRGIE